MDTKAIDMEDWEDGGLNVNEACEFASIGRSMLYDEMGAGRIVYRKLGTRRIVSKRSLIRLLSAGSPSRDEHAGR